MSESGKEEKTRTVDEIINKIGKSPNFSMFVITICALSCAYAGTIFTYMVQFTGFIPNEKYTCLSQKCFDLKNDYTSKTGKSKFDLIMVSLILHISVTVLSYNLRKAISINR